MKRLFLLMLSLLLVLALAGCGKAKDEPDADAAEANVLTNGEQLPITEAGALEYDNSSVTCRFRKDEDGWKWVDNETFPLDAAYVEEILTALDTMSAELTPLDPTVDPAESGLDEPNRYMTVTVGEEVTTLRFGDQKDDGTWYMSIDGQEGVYLVEDAFVALMDRSIYDMAVLPTLPELTDENLTVITVRQPESGKTVRLTKNDDGWVNGTKAMANGIGEIETALAELSFDKCFNYDPSPDAAPLCGLDAPTAVITLAYVNTVGTEATVTLTLGTLREDGTYYATLNDETTVYLLAQEKVASLLALL